MSKGPLPGLFVQCAGSLVSSLGNEEDDRLIDLLQPQQQPAPMPSAEYAYTPTPMPHPLLPPPPYAPSQPLRFIGELCSNHLVSYAVITW